MSPFPSETARPAGLVRSACGLTPSVSTQVMGVALTDFVQTDILYTARGQGAPITIGVPSPLKLLGLPASIARPALRVAIKSTKQATQ